MAKKNWWKYLCLCLVSLLLAGCSLMEDLFLSKSEVPEFAFSGYVYADGKPLSGATVSCGVSSLKTNDLGYFSFSGINQTVQVSVSKDGYLFSDNLVFVEGVSEDIKFSGFKLFDKTGVVRNNNVTVPFVDIIAESENGEFRTQSNEYGAFYLPNLAGQVKVTATKEGFNFFKSSFTIDKEDEIVISGTTNISGEIKTDDDCVDISKFTLKINGIEKDILSDLSFVAEDIEPGTIVSLSSDEYFIENENFEITSDLQKVIFDCKKYYDVNGVVSCGNINLNNAKIKCGNKEINSSDGTFAFADLYGSNTISATLENYVIESMDVDFRSTNVVLKATTSVNGKINLDIGSNFEDINISINGKNITSDSIGKFSLSGVSFGDKLIITSDSYHVENEIVISNRDFLNINAQKLFNLDLTVLAESNPLENANICIGGNSFSTNAEGKATISNLYGDVDFVVTKDEYKFEDTYSCDYFDKEKTIDGYILYSINKIVKSGDIDIIDCKVYLDNQEIATNNGIIALENIYGDRNLKVVAEGYNEFETTITKDNANEDINLTYDIVGKVVCGKKRIAGVVVSYNGNNVKTENDGSFVLNNLSGNVIITYSKERYTFPSSNVSSFDNLEVFGKYSISGNVKKQNDDETIENVSNLKMTLLDKETGTMQTVQTDNNGNYYFENLTSEYALFYDMDCDIALKPSYYDVLAGGEFNFSNTGYSFGGVITCGEEKLEGVTLTLGNISATTDKNGVYNFGLVTSSDTLIIEKEGYTFTPIQKYSTYLTNKGFGVNDQLDTCIDVNFTATYMVEGNIKCGKTPLDGVTVTIGEKSTTTNNGYFSISGLTGKNDAVELSYRNYNFGNRQIVDGYANLNYVATFNISANVISNDLKIENAQLYINNKSKDLYSDENGNVIISNIQFGDKISFVLNGYTIESKIIEEYVEDLNFNSSYKVSGRITNCGVPLNQVKVSIVGSEIFTETNENGQFELANIYGTQQLNFEKQNFNFVNKIITGTISNLEIMSLFNVQGTIKVGGTTPLAGVLVKAGDKTDITDEQGNFEITGLTSTTTFEFEKEGYDFGSSIEVSTPAPLDIYATFCIKGTVKSGDVILSGAKITTNTGMTINPSDENGNFEIYGLTGNTTIYVEMDNYNKFEQTIKDYNGKFVANLSYDVVINFGGLSGLLEYQNISITAVDNIKTEKFTCNKDSITIPARKGRTTITLSKENCFFTPTENNSFIVTSGKTQNITITRLFSVYGKVKTNSGQGVAFAKVSAGKVSTTTDIDGNYTLSGLAGEPKLIVKLPYDNQEIEGKTVKADGQCDISIKDEIFAVNFLNYAYDNLRNANSYQIFGSGTVIASPKIGGTQEQSVNIIYKQDRFGNKIFQNMNKGNKIDIVSVDPNVSMLSCFYTENGVRKVKYQQIKGIDNFDTVKQGNEEIFKPKYTETWSYPTDLGNGETELDWYRKNYGVDGNNFSPYIIKSETVNSVSNLQIVEGNYVFTLNMKTSKDSETYTNYAKLMSIMCDAQSLEGFNEISLTFTITRNGLLRKMVIYENYSVESSPLTGVPVNANITYDFIINSLTEKISDIDISTPLTVQNSIMLGRETPTENDSINYKENNNTTKVDLITFRKEEIL